MLNLFLLSDSLPLIWDHPGLSVAVVLNHSRLIVLLMILKALQVTLARDFNVTFSLNMISSTV